MFSTRLVSVVNNARVAVRGYKKTIEQLHKQDPKVSRINADEGLSVVDYLRTSRLSVLDFLPTNSVPYTN